MNPHAFAKAECANYMIGGCWDTGPCKLKAAGSRCAYFEKAVLPYELKRPDLFNGAAKDYWNSVAKTEGVHPAEIRQAVEAGSARLCACGEPLLPRHRLCDGCAQRRKRDAAIAGMKKKRSMLIVNAENAIASH